jgi:hypothetical protein
MMICSVLKNDFGEKNAYNKTETGMFHDIIFIAAPSAPENVLVLEIGPEEFVAVWKRSKILNAPIGLYDNL